MAKIEINGDCFKVTGNDPAKLNGKKIGKEVLETRKPQMRWKDNSYLTKQQVAGERADMAEDWEQQRIDPL